MKNLVAILLFIAGSLAFASEPGFVTSFQPLGRMAGNDLRIAQVTCISKWAFSDDDRTVPIYLIHRPFHPPTDTDAKSHNCNLASVVGLTFKVDSTLRDELKIVLDASSLKTEKETLEVAGVDRELVIMASLECLRRCTPHKLKNLKVIVIAKDEDKQAVEKIVQNFNQHDKATPFFGNGS